MNSRCALLILAGLLGFVAGFASSSDEHATMRRHRGRPRLGLMGLLLALISIGAAQPLAGMPAAGPSAEPRAERGAELRLADLRGGVAPVLAGPSGGRVFLAQGPRIEAYPARPEAGRLASEAELRSPVLPGLVIDMVAEEGRIYASLLDHGLWILDAGDLAVIGAVETLLPSSGVEVWDAQAYLAEGAMGLTVLDVSDPAAPRRLGRLEPPDRDLPDNQVEIETLHRFGDRLLARFTDSYSSGDLVAVYSLRAEAMPVLEAVVALESSEIRSGPPSCSEPAAAIRHQYRAYALDLCDPAAPRLLDVYPRAEPAELVALSGAADRFLVSVDREDLESGMSSAGLAMLRFDPETGFGLGPLLETRAAAEVLHLSGPLGLSVDLDEGGGLTLRWIEGLAEGLETRATMPLLSHSVRDVERLEDGSWVATAEESLWRMAPAETGGFGPASALGAPELWNASSLARVEGHLFVRTSRGVLVFDARMPERIRPIASLDAGVFGLPIVDLAASGERLVAVARASGGLNDPRPAGLFVFDASLPASPVLLGSLRWEPAGTPDFLFDPVSVEQALDRVLVASERDLLLVDISDPAQPALLDRLVVQDGLAAATLDELGQVYVASQDGSVDVYRIAAGELEHLQRLPLDQPALGLVASDGMLLAVTAGDVPLAEGRFARVRLFEPREGAGWVETRSLALPGDAYLGPVRGAASGGRMALAMKGYGLQLIDARPAIERLFLPWLVQGGMDG